MRGRGPALSRKRKQEEQEVTEKRVMLDEDSRKRKAEEELSDAAEGKQPISAAWRCRPEYVLDLSTLGPRDYESPSQRRERSFRH